MQKISFRPFIIFSSVAALLITAGVFFYWRQVTVLLEKDVRTHIADTTKDSAGDFNRLVETDREILATTALSFEDSYPWEEDAFLSEMLARFDQNEHFHLLGLALKDGRTFYSSLSSSLSAEALHDILKNTSNGKFYLTVRPREKEKYPSSILIQAIPIDPNDDSPVGALFAVQKEEYYKNILGFFATENGGKSFIIDRKGNTVLSSYFLGKFYKCFVP